MAGRCCNLALILLTLLLLQEVLGANKNEFKNNQHKKKVKETRQTGSRSEEVPQETKNRYSKSQHQKTEQGQNLKRKIREVSKEYKFDPAEDIAEVLDENLNTKAEHSSGSKKWVGKGNKVDGVSQEIKPKKEKNKQNVSQKSKTKEKTMNDQSCTLKENSKIKNKKGKKQETVDEKLPVDKITKINYEGLNEDSLEKNSLTKDSEQITTEDDCEMVKASEAEKKPQKLKNKSADPKKGMTSDKKPKSKNRELEDSSDAEKLGKSTEYWVEEEIEDKEPCNDGGEEQVVYEDTQRNTLTKQCSYP